MFSFNNKTNQEKQVSCFCSSTEGFFITKRQASIFSASIIFLMLGVFISGYFWGQKKAVVEFTDKLNEDSFTDKVNYSFYSMYGNQKQDDFDTQVESKDEELKLEEAPVVEVETQNLNNIVQENIKEEPVLQANKKQYYAELIGFGSSKSAQQFVNKLQKMGYNTFIKTRTSKTAKGKEIKWYQVLTEKFDDREKLNDMVNEIKRSENIKEVRIVTA